MNKKMKLFISPSEKSGKITDASVFRNRLLVKWPDIVIKEIADVNRSFILEWEFYIGKRYLTGKLDRTEDMLVFEFSDIELGAEFAIWSYQNLLRIDNVIIYNDDYSRVMLLIPTSNAADVIREFS